MWGSEGDGMYVRPVPHGRTILFPRPAVGGTGVKAAPWSVLCRAKWPLASTCSSASFHFLGGAFLSIKGFNFD